MRSVWSILKFGLPYIKPYWQRFVLGVLLGVLFGLTNASFVILTKIIFERIGPNASHIMEAISTQASGIIDVNHWRSLLVTLADPWLPLFGRAMDWKQAVGILFFFPFIVFFRGAVGYLSSYSMNWVSQRAVSDLRIDVLRKLTSLSIDYFNKSSTGDLLTRVNADTGTLQTCLSLGFSDLVKEPITLISVFIALCFVDWQLAIASTLFLPGCIIPILVLARKVRKAAKDSTKAQVLQSSLLVEMLASIRIIKAFGLEESENKRFSKYSHELVTHNVRSVKSKELVNPIIETISTIGLGAIILYICLTGRPMADLIGFLTGMIIFYTPVKKLASLHVTLNQTRVGVERLQQVFEEKPTVSEPLQPVPLPAFHQEIRFSGVSFSYDHRTVLENIDLTIPKGCWLGIAGESGSGKSTMLNLIYRFYDPVRGSLKMDGINFRDVSTSQLRSQMALVSQETILFDQTVAENIGSGRKDATRPEIEAASRAAGAHEFVQHLPLGYDTKIGERGVTLSGGQRQRLAIARAFVRNAPILVLDEATASLDSRTEEEVQKAIDQLCKDRTVICVAHRLSTLKNCHEIIVLDHGRIVQKGTYDQLLKIEGGHFAQMAARQGILV